MTEKAADEKADGFAEEGEESEIVGETCLLGEGAFETMREMEGSSTRTLDELDAIGESFD